MATSTTIFVNGNRINLFDAVSKARRQIKPGDVVTVCGGFGRELPERVTVLGTGIEQGEPVIDYRDRTGRRRWAYQTQILED